MIPHENPEEAAWTSKMIFLSMLLFVAVRGLAEAEPFDLLLPLWAVVLLSLLIACEGGTGAETALMQPGRRSGFFPLLQRDERG